MAAARAISRNALREETADGFMNGIGGPFRGRTIVVFGGFPEDGHARPDRAEARDGRRTEQGERGRARGGREMRGSRVGPDEERRARRETRGGGRRRRGSEDERKRKRRRKFLRKGNQRFRPALFSRPPAEH